MPSLRKRVSTYLRQLSFHNEPRDKKNSANENAFITKYLQGFIALREGPPIIYGKNPTDLPSYELGRYESGASTVIGCYSGPNGGLTTVKRTEKHLSVLDDDIDFIDNHEEEEPVPIPKPKKSPQRISGQPIDNTTMVIKVAGNEYCVTNKPKRHSKSYSLGSIADFNIEVEKTKIDKEFYLACDKTKDENENLGGEAVVPTSGSDNEKTGGLGGNTVTNSHKQVVRQSSESSSRHLNTKPNQTSHNIPNVNKNSTNNYALAKSRSDGNPFGNKKRGKIIQVQRQRSERGEDEPSILTPDDTALPPEWNQKSDTFYGISDSLYDRNQVTRYKNGDPIADCFGLIAREDSAILAVADGVNWGEKASLAAKSAIHASLHYLNKTIFNDTKPFEKLTVKTDQGLTNDTLNPENDANLVSNTREVFVCLLRAFNCAHDLILENKGMLTTLTVAVVLPLKPRQAHRSGDGSYVCCVCNVGDTLAYVYSQKTGIRELTKGWGSPEHLERLFNFRKIISNRDKCYELVPRAYPLAIINSQRRSDCYLIEGKFRSPFALHLPGIVAPEVQDAYFQMVLPLHWTTNFKPICIHLAGTGDHYFWRRRNMMVKPLLKAGMGAIILENPFYGLRKPKDQIRSSVHHVSDIFVMGGCQMLECLVLLNWCEQLGFGPLGITGISMGGHIACLAASNWPKPLVVVPCLSWSTASSVFTEGMMSESINWDMLQAQYMSDKVYCEELSKACKIVDDPFACNLSKSLTDYEIQCEMDLVDKLKPSYVTPYELINKIKLGKSSYHPRERLRPKMDSIKNIPPFIPSKKVIEMKKRAKEALWFMRGMMDECTHLKNFSVPVDTSLIISVTARTDAYVPRKGVSKLDEIWHGATVKYLDCGHVAAYIWHRKIFRDAIIEAFERAKKKTKYS